MHDKVKCLECGHEMSVITSQHLKICCGLTVKEYREKYPTAKIISEKVKKIRQNNCEKLNTQTKRFYCITEGCTNYIEKTASNHWKYICDKCRYPISLFKPHHKVAT